MTQSRRITLDLNGQQITRDVPVRMHLTDFLRQSEGLTGSHIGCEHGVCGACTVAVDGMPVRGCLMLAVQADGARVTTVEALADDALGARLQAAFLARNALQCGFCTPGMLASAIDYIASGGTDDRDAIRAHLSGNYCRCTGYQAIVDAVGDVIAEEQP